MDTKRHHPRPVPSPSLRWACDPAWIAGETTEKLEPGPRIPGQPLAVEALRFAAECGAPAQNVLVRGLEDAGGFELALDVLDDARADAARIVEEHPTVENLGEALLRARGGFLMLRARELAIEPGALQALVRALRTRDRASARVVVVGTHEACEALRAAEPAVDQLFKVLADLEPTMERSPECARIYSLFLARLAKDEALLPFDRSAIAALVEHGARIAAMASRVTARLWRVADLAREAEFLARKSARPATTSIDVEEAIRRTKRRGSVGASEFQRRVADRRLLLQVHGAMAGQVNGLSIIEAGPLTYGIATRITACVGPGSDGIVDIDKASDLSGPIHAKGFHILETLLRGLLLTDTPLSFTGSVAFEQTYGYVDGDSAAAAEVCCLLSALTGVPLRQGLAITGSVDQLGQIQGVGGVNEKIEGFFDTCRTLGLDGQQGVIVPATNIGDLMLRRDVVETCAENRFAVYSVETIQDALELLSGMPAGIAGDDGAYPEGSFLRLAQDKARELAGRGHALRL